MKNLKLAIALMVLGAIFFIFSFVEKLYFNSYCTGSSYCGNLYAIPELEIGIFGAVLLFAGAAIFFYFLAKREKISSAKKV